MIKSGAKGNYSNAKKCTLMHMPFHFRQFSVIATSVALLIVVVLSETKAVMAQTSRSTRTHESKGSSSGTPPAPVDIGGFFAPAANAPRLRVLNFPPETIGDLEVIRPGIGTFVGRAQGTVRVTLPAHSILSLQVNGRLARNPELLLQAPEHNIEHLKIALIDMENDTGSATDKVLKYISHLKDLRNLDVSKSDITEQGCEYMEGAPNLAVLDIGGTLLNKRGLESICKLTNMRWLKIQQAHATDDGFANIGQLKKLLDLVLKNNDVGDFTAKRLASLPNLQYICFSGTKITDDGVRAWRNLKTLFNVELEHTRITDNAIEALAHLPSLWNLYISDNAQVTDKCIPSILRMKKLKRLSVKNTSISFDGLQRLKSLNLDYLEIGGRYSPEQLQKLKLLAREVKVNVPSRQSKDAIYDGLLAPRH